MKTIRVKCYLFAFVILFLSHFVYAQWVPGHSVVATTVSVAGSPPEPPNGISVDRPKVFDNRTLTLMLETLSESLRNVQFINQQTLASALQMIQGFQTKEVSTSFSIGTRPTPKITQSQKTTTGNATEGGAPLPDTTETNTGSERAAENLQPPSLEALPAFSGFTPNYGENAADLLSDQVNLTYRIFNLRMLLERSLSDRLLSSNEARRQAVLGFNVTVDPPRTAEDAVAVVEITLNLADHRTGADRQSENSDGLSLVSMMPEEKTYNAAALSTKSNAFGGAATAKMINVGYSERRRGQTFYLYRDADTVAYQRMNEGKLNQVTFGWMFRPVLGRRSVSPGLRQLFAIVALPKDDRIVEVDRKTDDTSEYLNASVRTYWKKYDRDTMTSFEAKDANRFARFRYALSMNLSKPEIFASRYENKATYAKVEIKPTSYYQDSLRPKVSAVTWRPIGAKSIIISASGENFFTETKVALGDKTYSTTADGLILKSNQSFDLTTTIDALANGNGSIIGRYGKSVPLIAKDDLIAPGKIRIVNSVLSLPSAGHRKLIISLSDQNNILSTEYLKATFDLSRAPYPIITVNGKPVPLPYEFFADDDLTKIQCDVPESSFVNGGGILKVSYPFLPNDWTATWLITNPDADFEIARFTKQSILISNRNALGFDINPLKPNDETSAECWELLIAGKRYPLNSTRCKPGTPGTEGLSPNIISIDLSAQKVDIPDNFILISPWKALFSLTVPKSPAAEPPAKPLTVGLNDRVFVPVPVTDAAEVGRVEAAHQSLDFILVEPEKENEVAKTIKVQTDGITGKAGDVDISIFNKKGKLLKIVTLQVICKTCRDKGDK